MQNPKPVKVASLTPKCLNRLIVLWCGNDLFVVGFVLRSTYAHRPWIAGSIGPVFRPRRNPVLFGIVTNCTHGPVLLAFLLADSRHGWLRRTREPIRGSLDITGSISWPVRNDRACWLFVYTSALMFMYCGLWQVRSCIKISPLGLLFVSAILAWAHSVSIPAGWSEEQSTACACCIDNLRFW